MESYIQQEDLLVFGIQVKTFPLGIQESFEQLMKIFGADRSYYGISWCADADTIEYYAMVPEAFAGEAKKYNYQEFLIPKGQYRTVTLLDWFRKTASIKDIFNGLTAGNPPNKSRPCIEWYKSDLEMLCMVRAD